MPQIAKFYQPSSGTWSIYPANSGFLFGANGAWIIANAIDANVNPAAVQSVGVWYTFHYQDDYYLLIFAPTGLSYLLTEKIRLFDLPIADAVMLSPDFAMAAPNLTFDFDIIGKQVPHILGTLGIAGDALWAKGVESSGTPIVAATLSLAVGLGLPIDPTEVVTLGRIWCNDKLIYTPTDGPLLDLFTSPTLYQGTPTQLPDPLILADKVAADTLAYRDLRYAVFQEFPVTAVGSANPRFFIEMIAPARIRLDDAIVLILAKCKTAVTVEGVDDMISGAMFEDGIQPQDFLRLLHEAYGIDVVSESPLILRKRPVGNSLVIDHLRDFSDAADRAAKQFKFTRQDDTQTPNEVDVYYIDAERNYDRNFQPYKRPKFPQEDTPSTGQLSVTLPFSITATEAKQLAAEIIYRKKSAAVGAEWVDDDLTFAQGDIAGVDTPQGGFVMKFDELQRRPDNAVSITASGLLPRTGIDALADAGDLVDGLTVRFFRLWAIMRPNELLAIDGILYDPVFSVENTQAGLLHVRFDALPDTVNTRQIVLGDASVFGDGWIAGTDGAYTYVINRNHIIRIQRTFPYAHQELSFVFSGVGFLEPALVKDGLLRVVASASGGSALYTLNLNNFDPSGITTIDLDDDPISVNSIVENATYVTIGGSVTGTPTIWRVTKAGGAVVTDTVAQAIGSGVSDGTIVYYQPLSEIGPYVAKAIGTTYTIATRSLGTFDLDDDITDGRGLPYFSGMVLDGTTLAYLIAVEDAVFPNLGPVHLVTRTTPGLTPVDSFDLSDIPGYDPATYYPSWILKIPGFYIVAGMYFRPEGDAFGVDEAFVSKIADDLSSGTLQPLPASPPVNDDFADASSASSAFANTGTTAGASKEVGEDDHAGEPGGRSVWWVFTVPTGGSGTWRFDASATRFPCIVAIVTGSAVGATSEVASDTSVQSPLTAVGPIIDVALTAGTIYHVVIDGLKDSQGRTFGGTYSFTITPP